MRCLAHIAAALLSVGCATLRTDAPRTESHALEPVADTPSSRYIQSELRAHEGLSGFRLLSKADNALLSRIVLADHAQHSIDLQYYIFNNDATGRLLAQHLLTAADRGVRVRILVDDINSGEANAMLSALTTHANIQVRMFNPFRTRNPSFVSKVAQMLIEGRRLNRRMHNKSFVVDGWAAVVGGRNIGDEYFDAKKDGSFRDLDVIAIGPVVAAAAQSFDKYWNCDAAFPLMQLRATRPAHERVRRERSDLAEDAREFAQSDYAQAVREDLPEGPTADRRGEWFWGNATFVADEPEKIQMDKDQPWLRMGPEVKQLFEAAQSELVVISPYFVPGDRGVRFFSGLRNKGVEVKVLTNSLASTDELAVYAWYEHYRRALLEQGVHLYELRPVAGEQPTTSGGTSSGVSLHAKAAVIDRRWVLIGSMNMDPRSRLLNTEMGVIVDCAPLAQAVIDFFDAAAQPQTAFAVELEKDAGRSERVIWRADDDGKPVTFGSAPGASSKKRAEVVLYRLLPIEQLL